ncbi:response regulator transcription factor [Bifidobacterium oedipodis]|uniref:Transcriptional regulator n=1 Tax=Bifidobacterium oedipodis TaxID=2675322 RepID=A0A7Y0ERL9_9BIFI|nr:response regulator transcription factor [Bifidobacterium sp. DSM 109957]NMM94693.1 transcriptional regulator [Bifidobacterium sp. DSM 109957]
MSEAIRVLLADDDAIIREGLASLLNRQNGISVVAVAENGSQALRELSKQTVDVALLDVDMPVLDGIATAKEVARLYPSVAVVMLTVFEHEESLAKSLALNVRGFLTKDIPSAQLAQLIKQAHAGYSVFGPRPTQILADSYLSSGKNDPGYDDFRAQVEQLPDYLRATFDLLIQALPNKTIAKKLGLSEATVRSYISEIFTALGYTNRGELTITAIKAGY